MISVYRVLRDVETAKQWAEGNFFFPLRMISIYLCFEAHLYIEAPGSVFPFEMMYSVPDVVGCAAPEVEPH